MKKKKGFSMIELLTTMAILGVVLTMVYQNYFY
ncbi:type II secretion system protein, partial [candidate division WOR-3 bacterium]|nr:type II secretion system protein [candidate division WOR-3 bacterium]